MRNPKINRLLGYIVMFIGFGLFCAGFHQKVTADGEINTPLVIVSLVLIIGAFLWMLLKVRCPHCGGMLNIKLGNIDICPHCGKSTDV